MCDCYDAKCELCDEGIPMHIADFNYPREDFKVWCRKHIAEADPEAIVFLLTEAEEIGDENYPLGWACAILGPEVGDEGGNHPNLAANWVEMKVRYKRHLPSWGQNDTNEPALL